MSAGIHTWEIFDNLQEAEKQLFANKLGQGQKKNGNQYLRLVEAYQKSESQAEAISRLGPLGKDKKNHSLRLRVLTSRVFNELKSFLASLALMSHRWKDLLLLEELHKRKFHKSFMLCFRQVKKRLETYEERSFIYYHQLFELESLHQNQLLQFQTKPEVIPYQDAVDAFENWWIHQKLSLACFAKGQKRTRNLSSGYDILIPEILELIDNDVRFRNKPVLKIYKNLYLFLSGNSAQTIHEIEEQIVKYIKLFSQDEKHSLFAIIYNTYVVNFNKSRSEEDAAVLLSFFEWGLKENVLISQDRISWDFYRNILEICIILRNYNQAESYIGDLYENLDEEEREELFPYFRGRLLYAQKRYREAIPLLHKRFEHPLLEVSARFFYLQALYEQDDWYVSEILRILEGLGRYIRKNKALKNLGLQQRYLKRFTYFKKLLKAKTPQKQEILLQELLSEKAFSGKKWMIEKLNAPKVR